MARVKHLLARLEEKVHLGELITTKGCLKGGLEEKMADMSPLLFHLFPSSSFPSFFSPHQLELFFVFFIFLNFIIFGIPMVGLFFLRLTVKSFQPANQKVRDHKRQS